MFKKKKKDKQRGQAEKNQKNLAKENDRPDSSMIQDFDDTDGFDGDGFVDLQPIESDSTVLGPRQRCMYVGTFAVTSGTDGKNTLKTHKERTTFLKDHLIDYRHKQNGVDVMLQMSSDGIKIFNADASKVRMAYPLQRISFANCDPDFCLFTFMTYSPSPDGVAVHGHVFVGDSSKQVQDITAMVGKAFKLAFASSKLKKPGMNTGDIVPSLQRPAVRKWAKHEIKQGHDYTEHAAFAKDKKKALHTKNSNGSTESGDGSPVLERKTPTTTKPGWRNGSPAGTPPSQRKTKGLSLGSRFFGDDDSVSDSISEMSISSTTTKEEINASGVTVHEANVSSTEIVSIVSSLPSSPERTPDALNASAGLPPAREVSTSTTSGSPPLPLRNHVTRKEQTIASGVTVYEANVSSTEIVSSLPSSPERTPDALNASAGLPPVGEVSTSTPSAGPPLPLRNHVTRKERTIASGVTVYEASVSSTEIVSSLPSSPEKTPDALNASAGLPPAGEVSTSTPSAGPPLPLRNHVTRKERSQSDPVRSIPPSRELRETGPSSSTKVMYMGKDDDENVGNRKRADTSDRPATHHDEYWYMPGIPREFIVEMLQSSEDGSFFVRDSQSRPGCHALTVRVPKDFIPEGFANYLITQIPEGVKLEGFTKTFPDLMTLIEHYTRNGDELPCKLTLAGSNMLCEDEDEDYTNFEPADPDYQLLSDFHSMMDELK